MSDVICILLFVSFERLSSDSDVVEDAKKVPLVDETDDSCIKQPPDRAADMDCTPDFTGPVVKVRQQALQDEKLEDADENDMEQQDFSVNVRVYTLHILMFSKHVAHDDVFTGISALCS